MKKQGAALFLAILLLVSAVGCGKTETAAEAVSTGIVGVLKDEEFGNVYIEPSIEAFHALGFDFGDSVDLAFDDGTVLEDIPYYSGYYVSAGELLLCGYPGYPHPVLARNYGASTWEEFSVTQDSRVTVTLREKGKYAERQELCSLVYSDDRADFASDAVFANFREIAGGALREGAFYRSASPCDNRHNRAPYADAFAEEYGIGFVLNLADTAEKYEAYAAADDFASEYYDALLRGGNVLLLGMNMNYRADAFAETLADAFAEMAEHDAPCLIHCTEGKDRTGFACALLLALAGASAQEITDDYMITYDNYYHITKESEAKKYAVITENVDDFLLAICGAEKGTPIEALDLQKGAEDYLRRGGLSDGEIARIEAFIR